MTRPWTVYPRAVECGLGPTRHLIPADAPVRIISTAILCCEAHASVPVDWDAVRAARLALVAAQRAPAPRTPSRPLWVKPIRKPLPFSAVVDSLSFDPRAAAASDEP